MEAPKMEETKIIYHVDDEDTPYLVKLPIPPDRVTLGDLKSALNRPNFKFFFKSMDDDFGVVKEEIVDDDGKLPCFNGRVVCWLVSAEGSSISDNTSQCTDTMSQRSDIRLPMERTVGIGDSRPPSFHATAVDHRDNLGDTTCTETESVISSRRDHRPHHSSKHRDKHYMDQHGSCNCKPPLPCGCGASRLNGHSKHSHGRSDRHRQGYESSSMMTSDIETTSFLDSEDDTTSRISTTTEETSVSRIHARHRRRRRRHRMPPMSRTSSISSITDSTMSLNIITVTLNLDTVNFLGISIVGQSNKGGDGGIYVGSIMKGGAVALDGRIEPGDMILQVNDINFENMSNDDAVRVLREAVQKPGPIKLVVAKCWDPNPKGYFTIPRMEPVRPIDPGAWVAHTEAARVEYPLRPPSVSTLTSTSSSITSSIPESDRQFQEVTLSLDTDMLTICKAMAAPDSGLDVRDRMWLKITIANAFIGADVVDWLFNHVQGFQDRREARKYATQMLKANYIRHTVNKITFSEQCYYIFGDLCSKTFPFPLDLAALKVADEDTVSEADRDTLGPLPPPSTQGPWGSSQISYTGSSYLSQPGSGFHPLTFGYSKDLVSYTGFSKDAGSIHSGSGGSSNGAGVAVVSVMASEIRKEKDCKSAGSPAGSDSEVGSQIRRPTSDGRNSSHSSSGSSHHSGEAGAGSSHVHHMGLPPPHHHHHSGSIMEGMTPDLAEEDDVLEYHFTDKGMV